MKQLEKYHGIIPAFYACYNDHGAVSIDRTKAFTRYLIEKGVHGLYVGGSSGECIYQTVDERKQTLKAVVEEAAQKITIIAHVGCNNTADSQELAQYAESLQVDAIAAIPPIYFKLPEHSIADYWNDISHAAKHTDFIIYNIPQLAGVALTESLLKIMQKNPRLIGVKNSSMPVQDIQKFKNILGSAGVVFNGPDEQLAGGLAMGADGGIGGTYAIMPELYLSIYHYILQGKHQQALHIQNQACQIIEAMCACRGNLYAVMKEILLRKGISLGSVRKPLSALEASDFPQVEKALVLIDHALSLL